MLLQNRPMTKTITALTDNAVKKTFSRGTSGNRCICVNYGELAPDPNIKIYLK